MSASKRLRESARDGVQWRSMRERTTPDQLREVHGLSAREQRRYWGFRLRMSHADALQSAQDAERYAQGD